jgi:FkbM family methyltransferase
MRYPAAYRAANVVVRRLQGSRIRSGPAKGLRFHGGGTAGYVLGISEPLVQDALVRHLEPGGVFYDVGAHAGFMALLAARLVGPAGAVVAFDPIPVNVALFERNVAANRGTLTSEIRALPLALGDRDGRATMSADSAITAALSDGGDQEVEIARLDSLRGLRPPDVVKIDVEGAELEVLDGARNTLTTHGPVVIVEIHGNREVAVRAALGAVGYTRVELLDDGGMPHLLATTT